MRPPSLLPHAEVATAKVQAMVETMTTGCDSEEACIPQHIDLHPLGPPPQLPFPHVKAVLKKPLCGTPIEPGSRRFPPIEQGSQKNVQGPISFRLFSSSFYFKSPN